MSKLGMRNSQAAHVDFGFLKAIIKSNPKAMPSNLDMVFERYGCFLVGEWKRDNEEISLGQKILLKALSEVDVFTVLVINGYSDHTGTEINKFYEVDKDRLVYLGNGIDEFKRYINAWYIGLN